MAKAQLKGTAVRKVPLKARSIRAHGYYVSRAGLDERMCASI